MADALGSIAKRVATRLLARGYSVTTAESCTGGMVAVALTDIAGSSSWFERGFVTYSNAAKVEMLGVDAALIERMGAVSEDTARAMARGALCASPADLALAVTGIAGPTGAVAGKPVGTVCFAWAMRDGQARTETCHFDGNRASVRRAAAVHALRGVADWLEQE